MSSFKITCFNIQGMFSSAFGEKITNSDFVNIVYSSDIIILLETWSRLDSKSYTPPNYRELRIPSIKQPNVKNGKRFRRNHSLVQRPPVAVYSACEEGKNTYLDKT